MSAGNNDDSVDTSCCASCGIAEIDDIKLNECDDCDLVKYCSDECLSHHKSEHEEACKRRAAELRDELLFKQPENTYMGDCPICNLPLSLDRSKSIIYSCCCKSVCDGCCYANEKRQMEMRIAKSCPFCRKPEPKTKEEAEKLVLKRVEANDPEALFQEGTMWYEKGEFIRAFEYWTKAAGLGEVEAHYRLSWLYYHGEGVEKDIGKGNYHLEEAAIGGHPLARHNLGVYEWVDNENNERAVKHFIIAATQGQDEPMDNLMIAFKRGLVEKEVLAAVLRAHKAAVDATKSPQRKAAEKWYRFM